MSITITQLLTGFSSGVIAAIICSVLFLVLSDDREQYEDIYLPAIILGLVIYQIFGDIAIKIDFVIQ